MLKTNEDSRINIIHNKEQNAKMERKFCLCIRHEFPKIDLHLLITKCTERKLEKT